MPTLEELEDRYQTAFGSITPIDRRTLSIERAEQINQFIRNNSVIIAHRREVLSERIGNIVSRYYGQELAKLGKAFQRSGALDTLADEAWHLYMRAWQPQDTARETKQRLRHLLDTDHALRDRLDALIKRHVRQDNIFADADTVIKTCIGLFIESGNLFFNAILNQTHEVLQRKANDDQLMLTADDKMFVELAMHRDPLLRDAIEKRANMFKAPKLTDDAFKDVQTIMREQLFEATHGGEGARSIARTLAQKFGTDLAAAGYDTPEKLHNKVMLWARTEGAVTQNDALMTRGKNAGMDGKIWQSVGDDRVRPAHVANDAAGVIPVDEPFPDGSMDAGSRSVSPFNCRCVCGPAMLKDGLKTEDEIAAELDQMFGSETQPIEPVATEVAVEPEPPAQEEKKPAKEKKPKAQKKYNITKTNGIPAKPAIPGSQWVYDVENQQWIPWLAYDPLIDTNKYIKLETVVLNSLPKKLPPIPAWANDYTAIALQSSGVDTLAYIPKYKKWKMLSEKEGIVDDYIPIKHIPSWKYSMADGSPYVIPTKAPSSVVDNIADAVIAPTAPAAATSVPKVAYPTSELNNILNSAPIPHDLLKTVRHNEKIAWSHIEQKWKILPSDSYLLKENGGFLDSFDSLIKQHFVAPLPKFQDDLITDYSHLFWDFDAGDWKILAPEEAVKLGKLLPANKVPNVFLPNANAVDQSIDLKTIILADGSPQFSQLPPGHVFAYSKDDAKWLSVKLTSNSLKKHGGTLETFDDLIANYFKVSPPPMIPPIPEGLDAAQAKLYWAMTQKDWVWDIPGNNFFESYLIPADSIPSSIMDSIRKLKVPAPPPVTTAVAEPALTTTVLPAGEAASISSSGSAAIAAQDDQLSLLAAVKKLPAPTVKIQSKHVWAYEHEWDLWVQVLKTDPRIASKELWTLDDIITAKLSKGTLKKIEQLDKHILAWNADLNMWVNLPASSYEQTFASSGQWIPAKFIPKELVGKLEPTPSGALSTPVTQAVSGGTVSKPKVPKLSVPEKPAITKLSNEELNMAGMSGASEFGATLSEVKNVQLGGSTGAKLYVDKDNTRWVVKTYSGNVEQAQNEWIANQLYRELDVLAPESRLVQFPDGTIGVAMKFIDEPGVVTLAQDQSLIATVANMTTRNTGSLADGFVADAWLSNWDVIGTGYDNIMVNPSNPARAWRVDNGGSLLFRARGTRKGDAFSPDDVLELITLRNDTNTYSKRIFGGLNEKKVVAQIDKFLVKMNPTKIRRILDASGINNSDKQLLERALIGRYEFLKNYSAQRHKAEELLKQVEQNVTSVGERRLKERAIIEWNQKRTREISKEYLKSMPMSWQKDIKDFTGQYYTEWNNAAHYDRRYRKALDNALASDVAPGYRGWTIRDVSHIRGKEEKLEKWKSGRWAHVSWDAYSSSTIAPEGVFSCINGQRFVILNKGRQGVIVEGLSSHSHEREVLYGRNSVFRVIGYDKYLSKNADIIFLEEIEEDDVPDRQGSIPRIDFKAFQRAWEAVYKAGGDTSKINALDYVISPT